MNRYIVATIIALCSSILNMACFAMNWTIQTESWMRTFVIDNTETIMLVAFLGTIISYFTSSIARCWSICWGIAKFGLNFPEFCFIPIFAMSASMGILIFIMLPIIPVFILCLERG